MSCRANRATQLRELPGICSARRLQVHIKLSPLSSPRMSMIRQGAQQLATQPSGRLSSTIFIYAISLCPTLSIHRPLYLMPLRMPDHLCVSIQRLSLASCLLSALVEVKREEALHLNDWSKELPRCPLHTFITVIATKEVTFMPFVLARSAGHSAEAAEHRLCHTLQALAAFECCDSLRERWKEPAPHTTIRTFNTQDGT